jgi:thiopeptide-type bacteriocin biosynthesis protein
MRTASPIAEGKLHLAAADFFVMRTPFLSVRELADWGRGLEAPRASGTPALQQAVAHDVTELTQRLRAVVDRPHLREALFVASPSLDEALEAWLDDMSAPRARGIVEILVRYFARMSARSTPFGLFSGCSVGRVGDVTELSLGDRASYRRHVRLDMHYLAALCDELRRDPAIHDAVRYEPSSALWRCEDGIRYPEARVDPLTGERTFHLVSVESSPALQATLERAANGETIPVLAAALVDDEISLEEAASYVEELISMQLLVSDLEPTITGGDPLFVLCKRLGELAPAASSTRVLSAVREDLERLGSSAIGEHPRTYRAIAKRLASLPAKVDLSRLFHVDLYKSAGALQIGPHVVREVERTLAVLEKIGTPVEQVDLRSFREHFSERYGREEIPLLEALDEERGLGFGRDGHRSTDNSPLLAELPFPKRPGDPMGHRLDKALLSAMGPILRNGAAEWSLSAADIENLATDDAPNLPDALYACVTIAAPSQRALDSGDFLVVMNGVGGPSGANWLGRFCHGDPALRDHVRAHLREEESLRPDAIFAEIVHLPEGRMGNVLCRPLLRPHEIAYAGRSGAAESRQILVSDLLVSVRGRRVTLRSKRLGREIVPRMTTAHNWSAAELGVYRFLCALQHRESELGWKWGTLEHTMQFLPRVTHGRAVLAPARWNLSKSECRELERPSLAARFEAVQELRTRLGLPRWVSLGDHHNLYPIDLDNVLSVESCRGLLRSRERATLFEMTPAPDDICSSGPDGAFCHEIVLPFVRRGPAETPNVLPSPERMTVRRPVTQVTRRFLPGSEWLYAQIHAGTAIADRILVDIVAPLMEESSRFGDGPWFFIRYDEPDHHIRLRIKGEAGRLTGSVLPRLLGALAPLLDDRSVRSVKLDTYDREIERYGGPIGIELSERVFQADSEAVLSILRDFRGDASADARWKLTLRGMHDLLDGLELGVQERLALAADLRDRFAEEHRADVRLDRQLGATFRKERLELEALMKNGSERFSAGCRAFAVRAERLRDVMARLRSASSAGELTCSLSEIAASYLHMHANRMLRSQQRAHELVLYDFLARLYQSETARAKQVQRAAAS